MHMDWILLSMITIATHLNSNYMQSIEFLLIKRVSIQYPLIGIIEYRNITKMVKEYTENGYTVVRKETR